MSALLTPALEDYLETVYELVRDQKLARVRDIATARGVRAGSVSPAMRRLADLGLIRYHRREYVDLTPSGLAEARRIHARHLAMAQFFEKVLGLKPDEARTNAAAMEHSLTRAGMDRLVRFLEFAEICPSGKQLFEMFHGCSHLHEDGPDPSCCCILGGAHADGVWRPLSELTPGQSGSVTQVNGGGAIRQRLLDMGVLPKVHVEVERVALTGDPIWIRLQGFQLSLRKAEAASVVVACDEREGSG